MSRPPDYAEPLDGWRVWLVVEEHGEFRLRSVVFNVAWPPREALRAECHRGRLHLGWRREPGHDVPSIECDCGIYATSLERTAPYLDPRLDGPRVHRVLGSVSLWGSVVECTGGRRSSHAYPARLFVPDSGSRAALPAEEVAWALAPYGVPIEVADGVPPERLAAAVSSLESLASTSWC